ncbi:MAG: C40 family peptidase [Bacteroidia bacterium]|nr:C40 family peptidase [Bacteroidia bacterium]
MQRIVGLMVCLLVSCVLLKAQVPFDIDTLDSAEKLQIDTLTYKLLHNENPKKQNNQNQSIIKPTKQKNLRIDTLINFAHQLLGSRYRRGGTGSIGFDCSGYTLTVFKNSNIKLPHTSAGQSLMGIPVNIANAQKGDLIFFKGANRRSRRIGHVGIVISEKGEPVRFIHSSTSTGVRVDKLSATYYKNRYVKTVRIPELYQ